MIEVKVQDQSDEAFEKAMKIFKKVCQKDGFMMELRERRAYKKPSEKRRDAKREAIRKQKLKKRNKSHDD